MMPENTGIYFLTLSIVVIFGVVADFGITSVLIREIAKHPEKTKEQVQRVIAFKLSFLGIAFLGTLLVAFFLPYNPLIRQLILIASVVMIADSLSLFFYGILRGLQKLHYESLGIFLGQLLSVTMGFCVLFFFPSLSLLIIAILFGSLFNTFFSFFRVIKYLGFEAIKPVWNWQSTKLFFHMALPFALAAVFVKMYSYIDSILLSLYLGTEAVEIGR